MSKRRWFVAAGAGVAVVLVALAALPTMDYGAGASGLVVDENGLPVPGVAVRFTTNRTLYKVISPVRSARAITDDAGRFALHFIACGRPGGDYRLTLEKDGFQAVVIRGRGLGKHRVIMKALKSHAANAA